LPKGLEQKAKSHERRGHVEGLMGEVGELPMEKGKNPNVAGQ